MSKLFFILGLFFAATLSGHQPPVKESFLLITGCSHSGLNYLPNVFAACGLDVKNEQVGIHGTSSWQMAVPCDLTLTGKPGSTRFRFKHIFHQVRHPLYAIAAATNHTPQAWSFICEHIPQINLNDPPLVKAAKYWYYWNKKAEKIAELTYQVEALQNSWNKIGRHLGVVLDKNALFHMPVMQYSGACTWAKLKKAVPPELYMQILLLARHYGYAVENNILIPK